MARRSPWTEARHLEGRPATPLPRLGRGRVRSVPRRTTALPVAGRPAAALHPPIPLLCQRPGHRQPSPPLVVPPAQRPVADLEHTLDDCPALLPVRGAGVPVVRRAPGGSAADAVSDGRGDGGGPGPHPPWGHGARGGPGGGGLRC